MRRPRAGRRRERRFGSVVGVAVMMMMVMMPAIGTVTREEVRYGFGVFDGVRDSSESSDHCNQHQD